VKLQYISTDEQTIDILTKPLSRIKFAYLRDKLGIVEITPLAEREEMALQVGRGIDISLIYGQSFSSLENGPGWAVSFQFGKWFEIF
jgi:hypothetical protein